MQTLNSNLTTPVNHPNNLRGFVNKDILKKLNQVNTIRGIFSIASEWALIIFVAFLCERYFNWPAYVLSVVFIGAYFPFLTTQNIAYIFSIERSIVLNSVTAYVLGFINGCCKQGVISVAKEFF